MNKLEYVNKLLAKDDLSDYIQYIENSSLSSPPNDLKEKILNKCYNKENCDKSIEKNNVYKFKLSFIDVIKVACFALVITLCTELFMNATYASTKENNIQIKNKTIIYKLSDKVDNTMKKFSDFMLNYNLKGD